MNRLVFASVISEIQPSDIFMSVKARICEAPAANLNGARVTEAFIDKVISDKERYVGLPLYADIRALTNGNYRRLGHLYDSRTGEFHSTQIGSFYDFEKEEFDGGCYLVGYARIAKRNKKLSNALLELFADNALKFSFELTVGEYEELDDGTILIDASDSNYLEGTAIVTFPACEDAVALELVAQRKADDIEGSEKEMAEKKELAAEEAVEQPVVAEDEQVEETAEAESEAEETAACKKKENAEEVAETETAEHENADVVIRETTVEEQHTCAYDTETGAEVCQSIEVETTVSHVEPDAQIVEATDGVHIAEDADPGEETGEPSGETPDPVVEEETPETPEVQETPEVPETPETPAVQEVVPAEPAAVEIVNVEDSKKTAEQLVAELAEVVERLKKEIAELKEQKVTAEAKTVTAEANPFMSDINSEGRYSLLQKEEKRASSYSLLGKY